MNVETSTASAPQASVPPEASLGAAPPALLSPALVHHCENCGAAVTGRFCPDCGQRAEHLTYSVWHFLREATEDLTHADSRLWRTLGALLARPGFLTREFFAGRRARYLPPVRLYLVLSVLFFLIPGAGNLDQQSSRPTAAQPGAVRSQAQEEPQVLGAGSNCEWIRYDGPESAWLQPRLKASCYKVIADRGRGLQEQFVHNLPRALFVFLPLLALFMKLMYWRPRRYYVEHLLFFVHYHAAVFLLLTLSWLVRTAVPWHAFDGLVSFGVGVYVLVYLYRSLCRVYGQGHWLTSLKFLTLGVAYLFTGGLMLAILAVYSLLTL